MNRMTILALSVLVFCAVSLTICCSLSYAQSATTTTTITPSANPALIGSQLTYTVTVSSLGSAPLTGPVRISYNGSYGSDYILNSGSLMVSSTVAGPPRTVQVIASYLGDAVNGPSTSATLNEVIQAGLGLTPSTVSVFANVNPAYTFQTVVYTATVTGGATPTGTVSFYLGSTTPYTATLSSSGTATFMYSYTSPGDYEITANYSGDSNNGGSSSTPIEQVVTEPSTQPPLQFVPITPCRIADTRNPAGPFGGPSITGGQSRSFAVPQSSCNIPSTAAAYALNVTVVPNGFLGFLTIWPTGIPQPSISLLNSFDGRVKANAAIVPAGTSGAVSVFVLNTTDVVLDITGYFVPPSSSTLQFYPVTPCRMLDTRNPNGPLGGPYLSANQTRAFPLLSSSCGIPSTAEAYSLNVTAVPAGYLAFLKIWPTGQPVPGASTLNSDTGTTTANAAIVQAGTGGDVSVLVTNNSDLVIDVNGYFAPAGVGGSNLYTTTPCRDFDTRGLPFSPFPGSFIISPAISNCTFPNNITAFVFNVTVLPEGPLGSLTLSSSTGPVPKVSTLNALDGAVTSNMAIVPTNDNDFLVTVPPPNSTQLFLDISAYFGL